MVRINPYLNLILFVNKRHGNPPEKECFSKVEFSRKIYAGDSNEEIAIQ